MRAELSDQGLAFRPEWVFPGDFSLRSGSLAAEHWFALDHRPTAVFCACDQMAFGFISELSRRGIRVPDDISVAGFDDIEISGRFIPPLTTIRQPREDIGSVAAQMLIERIRSTESSPWPETDVLPVELVVRRSTASPQ